MNKTIRLNKFLANAGLTSRRNITELLKKEDVRINGQRVLEKGERVNPETDLVTVNGKKTENPYSFVYFLLNKPKGVISTARDEFGRKTVVSLIKTDKRVYPVGRLDENTTGLILLTNDGELTHHLTHPRHHIPKTYQVAITYQISQKKLNILKTGVNLKEGKTLPAQVKILEVTPSKTNIEIIIHEGRYHQIKRMFAKLNLNLVDLKRIAIGELRLGNLKIGASRSLTKKEIESLKKK